MRDFFVMLCLAIIAGLAVHLYSGMPLGWALFLFLVVWPVVGTLVTLDDDLPGGWSNPDGKTPYPWTRREFWGAFVLRGGIVLFGFAYDEGLSQAAAIQLLAAVSMLGVGAVMIRTPRGSKVANDV